MSEIVIGGIFGGGKMLNWLMKGGKSTDLAVCFYFKWQFCDSTRAGVTGCVTGVNWLVTCCESVGLTVSLLREI